MSGRRKGTGGDRPGTGPETAPGSAAAGGNGTDANRRRLLAWLWRVPVIAAVGAGAYAVYEGAHILFGKEPAREEPTFTPVEPVPVAPLAQFDEPWAAVEFDIERVPAIALRLPEPVPGGQSSGHVHLAAFSRICTHQFCTVSLNRDPEAVAFAFNYRGDTPALTCPCHLSVFLPTEAGTAVSGPAVAPLPRVQLRVVGDEVQAVGIEISG